MLLTAVSIGDAQAHATQAHIPGFKQSKDQSPTQYTTYVVDHNGTGPHDPASNMEVAPLGVVRKAREKEVVGFGWSGARCTPWGWKTTVAEERQVSDYCCTTCNGVAVSCDAGVDAVDQANRLAHNDDPRAGGVNALRKEKDDREVHMPTGLRGTTYIKGCMYPKASVSTSITMYRSPVALEMRVLRQDITACATRNKCLCKVCTEPGPREKGPREMPLLRHRRKTFKPSPKAEYRELDSYLKVAHNITEDEESDKTRWSWSSSWGSDE
ncbi:hypothetical protein SODALDRAFT_361252 [Sodiomyces alkalinus F11]|uniref:Uncharacterized protein n=1 Tax=Sodiomyces alkalinus (strain CBS 110278 / VKM F-3762 / F11) TaxID=1314773 RepID=A0A3N2PSN9_SODAK|nr:hypothetical protein SODALDRAFT_361252 [Sodiomyces alkalinus F11]ROT37539.1 hypothetical protein SODALDRAFT_361252 [Sodiomyces alkalinus F11]